MLTPTWRTLGKCLRQVQTHVGLQFQPHRPTVLRSRFHHRLFHSLLPQPRQKAVRFARHRDESPPRWFLFRHPRIHDNHHQNFLVYINPRDLHRFLLAWKRRNAREKVTHRHALPPLLRAEVARHRLVQNARSRSNSKTASLQPECKRTFAVNAPSDYTHNATPFSCQWVSRRPMGTQNPPWRPRVGFLV